MENNTVNRLGKRLDLNKIQTQKQEID